MGICYLENYIVFIDKKNNAETEKWVNLDIDLIPKAYNVRLSYLEAIRKMWSTQLFMKSPNSRKRELLYWEVNTRLTLNINDRRTYLNGILISCK